MVAASMMIAMATRLIQWCRYRAHANSVLRANVFSHVAFVGASVNLALSSPDGGIGHAVWLAL